MRPVHRKEPWIPWTEEEKKDRVLSKTELHSKSSVAISLFHHLLSPLMRLVFSPHRFLFTILVPLGIQISSPADSSLSPVITSFARPQNSINLSTTPRS